MIAGVATNVASLIGSGVSALASDADKVRATGSVKAVDTVAAVTVGIDPDRFR